MLSVFSLFILVNLTGFGCCCGSKCDVENSTRPDDGRDAGVNEFPMMAGLVDTENNSIYCGATIINNKQVLTIASCVDERDPDTIRVIVGKNENSGEDTNATKSFKVAKVIMHPSFSTWTFDYEIAVINIDGNIEFSTNVAPVCLSSLHLSETNQVDLLGWGLLQFGGNTTTGLKKIPTSVVSKEKCEDFSEDINDWSKYLCLFGEKTFCQYDSGGPILWRNPTRKNLVLVGMIVYNILCDPEEPSINIKIGPYIDWIASLIPEGSTLCKEE